jgi:hypothetical protein
MPEETKPNCQTCKFWSPRYFQIGRCGRESGANPKIWCNKDDAIILTHMSFSCSEYTEQKPDEDTL